MSRLFFVTEPQAGFIGFNVARRLLADGHRVVGYDGLTRYYDPQLKAARTSEGACRSVGKPTPGSAPFHGSRVAFRSRFDAGVVEAQRQHEILVVNWGPVGEHRHDPPNRANTLAVRSRQSRRWLARIARAACHSRLRPTAFKHLPLGLGVVTSIC